MANKAGLVIALIVIMVAFGGFVAYKSGNTKHLMDSATNYVEQGAELGLNLLDESLTKQNEVGDSITLYLSPSQVTQEEARSQVTQSGPVPVGDLGENSTIITEKGQTYGQTSQYTGELPENIYLIGNPVWIKFDLKVVKPGSCYQENGEVKCEYIEPELFDFRAEVSCEHRAFCPMDAPYTVRGTTENDGTYAFKWQTGFYTAGEYKVEVIGESVTINPATQRPYPVKVSQMIFLVSN